MTARLLLVVDVEGVDPALVDPEDIADDLLDHRYATLGGHPVSLASAEWQPADSDQSPRADHREADL